MEQSMKIGLFRNALYTKLLTWSFNMARDFIEVVSESTAMFMITLLVGVPKPS